MKRIEFPYNWAPREYQRSVWEYLSRGGKRAVVCWPRRHGKDDVGLQHMACAMAERPGTYWYLLPEYAQARKAVWDPIDEEKGVRRIDLIFPKAVRSLYREQEMMLGVGKSTLQILGADNYNSLVGSPPVGVGFSEYSRTDPSAWSYLMPILEKNGGWAYFNSTPFGDNHFKRFCEMAERRMRAEQGWFYQHLTAPQCGVYSPEQLLDIREQLIEVHGPEYGEALFLQEYYCLHPETRVLTADLTWVPLRDIREGQDLIGIDEQASRRTERKLRRATVTKRWTTTKPCRRLTFADGTTITASDEHPWLCKQKPSKSKKTGTYVWRETRDLTVGMRVAHIGLRPWEADTSWGGGYLSGLFDGEGCVARRSIQMAQRPGDVFDVAKSLLHDKGFTPYTTTNGVVKSLCLNLHDTLRALGSLRPIRLMKKAAHIWEGAFPFNGTPAIEITRIEDLGEEEVVGISTSTRTFIAEGFVTHNCSFDAAMPGAIFGDQIDRAKREGRIRPFAVDRTIPVYTGWDLGRVDATAIWWYQVINRELFFFDFHESTMKDVPFYVERLEEVRERYGIRYARHWLPHDARPRRVTEGAGSMLQQMTEAARRNPKLGAFGLGKALDKQEQIQAARKTLPLCVFHDTRCTEGLRALRHYHREYDTETKAFAATPVHDWSSHPADAFMTVAMTWHMEREPEPPPPVVSPSLALPTWGDMKKQFFARRRDEQCQRALG